MLTTNNTTSILGNGYVQPNTISTNATWTISSPNPQDYGTIQANDIILSDKSLAETLEKINERLLILVPDPDKLEKYEALKKAYEDYKLLEAMLK